MICIYIYHMYIYISYSIQRSGFRGLHLRLLPHPLCSGPSWFPLQVVGPLVDFLASLVQAWPGRVPQGVTPGLALGWDPGSAVPGEVTCLVVIVLMKVSDPLFV
ncbi:hypothetical protein ATANTOWER_023525 [Ataeniobius toweri]|uniref:Uncharacterized protein n=1 Tax=Ataeniobius toweri TaxID=208326 RepID=A0ABU7B3C0_9TELE|nr:hypothetical protein [Ataeniobius toweri]